MNGNPILVVDDDENDLVLFRRAAEKARIANPVVALSDGDAVIDWLSAFLRDDRPEPVVVLLDLKMPRRSGFDVLQWVRAQPGLRRLPVVVFTSSAQDPDVNRAYDLGANSYLVKPVTFETLVEMMRAVGLYWVMFNLRPELREREAGPT